MDSLTSQNRSRLPSLRRRGFNLVEAAIVLGVVGLVIGGIWVAAATVTENRKQARSLEQILEIASNLRSLYYGQPSFNRVVFTDVDNPAMMTAVYPADMIQATGYPKTALGHDMYAGAKREGGSDDGIEMWIDFGPGLSRCVTLGPRITTALRDQLNQAGDFYVVTGNVGLPVSTPSEANTNCQTEYDASSGNTSLMILIPF